MITLGGIGTIVAVLLVGAFLLAVAVPLFRPARVRMDAAVAGHVATEPVACLGTDETGAVAWLMRGAAGGIAVVGLADGETLLERDAAACGIADATAVRVLPGGMTAAVGFSDGSIRTGRIGLESSFVAVEDVPEDCRSMQPGRARADGDAVVLRQPNGRFARLRLVTELAPATRAIDGPITDIDVTQVAGGPFVAAIGGSGRVRVETVTSRRNLLTDEIVVTTDGATIERVAGFDPLFVRVSERGDQVFLIDERGKGRRHAVREGVAPEAIETFAAAPGDATVTAVERLFGGASLAVADSSGSVRVLFASRTSSAAATDGLETVAAKVFQPPDHSPASAITALAASPRSRLFAVADASGHVRLLQATTSAAAFRVQATVPDGLDGPAEALCLSPRETRLVASRRGSLAGWTLDVGHPDVSVASLFGPVWYENYPGPVHAWETTGHEAFESKFGLVPLIFGTVKSTIYSMLFATPVALLAAIYSSQFLHPRWRARIKPAIEMMASLPSVVLGFIAGMLLAPFVERCLVSVVAGMFVVPLVLLTAAHFWQVVPAGMRMRLAAWRLPFIGFVVLPAGMLVARWAGPWVERKLFDGDLVAWLDGRGVSGFGGWFVALLPLAAVAATILTGRFVNPLLREWTATSAHAAIAAFVSFAAGVLLAVAMAMAAAVFLDAIRLDIRGAILGTYVQRNALVVAIGMAFAIIPLVFTIADDALTSVPDHLRSASLGAGATPWQTAVRVIVPAAASGLFSAVMIGLGRAVGETMIVLMAAGNTPLIDWNLFNGFQTLSAAIATELPEAARGSTHYRVLFLAALALFAITFVVNTLAELVRQRFRRRAHEL